LYHVVESLMIIWHLIDIIVSKFDGKMIGELLWIIILIFSMLMMAIKLAKVFTGCYVNWVSLVKMDQHEVLIIYFIYEHMIYGTW
jgi:hypothetical protein